MELYDITFMDKEYHYTSYSEDLDVDGTIYKAIPINREEVIIGLDTSSFVFKAPYKYEPFNMLIYNPIVKLGKVRVRSYPLMYKVFEGVIINSSFDYTKHLVTIKVGSLYFIKETEVPKRTFSRECSFDFCDKDCGLNISNYTVVLESNQFDYINGTIKSNDIANIPYSLDGGMVKTEKGEYQWILKRDNDTIYLLKSFLYSPKKIEIYPTCNKSFDDCNNYNNTNNFGGFPYIPYKNATTEGY